MLYISSVHARHHEYIERRHIRKVTSATMQELLQN